MKRLGSAVLAAAVVVATIAAVPAGAAAPGQVTTVRGGCSEGNGTITMVHEQVSEELARVVVTGADVANGNWVGRYLMLDEGDHVEPIELQAEVVDHTFRVELEVTEGSDRHPYAYLISGIHRCGVAFGSYGPRFNAATRDTSLSTRFVESGVVAFRGFVAGCADGGRWRWTVRAEFAGDTASTSGRGRTCRGHGVHLPRILVSGESFGQDRPDAVRMVARSSTGEVRRVSWRLSTLGT